MSQRTIGVIQARMASSRYPGKVLSPLAGHPLLSVLVERVRHARVDEWWLATTDRPTDAVAAAWGEQLGLHVFRGDEEDVLSRFTGIIHRSERVPTWVVRLTADDPFVNAEIVDLLVSQAAAAPSSVSVVSELPDSRRFPLGYVPQIARVEHVLDIVKRIPEGQPHHRSHVLSWFYESGHVEQLEAPPDWPERSRWRWTVDTSRDLDMAQLCFRLLGQRWASASYRDMVALLDAHPEIPQINQCERQKDVSEG